jgi:hypothetical protein
VAIYHRRVGIGEIPDLVGRDSGQLPPAVVDHWLHYGRCWSPAAPAARSRPRTRTLTVQPVSRLPAGRILAITLYFAHVGSVTLRLPIESAVRPATRSG